MKVLIIEDEAPAVRALSNILSDIDDTIVILAVLSSVTEALNWFGRNDMPDLIFSDIQLADGLCFEIFEKISVMSPVIFCTAFDEYLMDAFESNAVSYIMKPINRQKVEKALEKFDRLRSAFEQSPSTQVFDHSITPGSLETLLQVLKCRYKSTLLINYKDRIIPMQAADITFFYLKHNILYVHIKDNRKYFLNSTLDELELIMDPSLFYRANRQFLINRNFISGVERFFARKLVVKMINDTPENIVISKAKSSGFLKWLEGKDF